MHEAEHGDVFKRVDDWFRVTYVGPNPEKPGYHVVTTQEGTPVSYPEKYLTEFFIRAYDENDTYTTW